MANVNHNKNQANTGGPSVQSTGEVGQTNQPDSQRSSAANATGQRDFREENQAPDVEANHGGPQPTDPVQASDEEE